MKLSDENLEVLRKLKQLTRPKKRLGYMKKAVYRVIRWGVESG